MKTWKLKPNIPADQTFDIEGILSKNNQPSPPPRLGSGEAGQTPLPSTLAEATVDKEGEGNQNLLAQLLFNRGLNTKEKADEFLNVKYENLHSPFLFKNMEKAVARIWQAIENKEGMWIYGDYDADAVTANAVLQQTFKYLGVDIQSYIPDRFSEGYGVNMDALNKIKEAGAKIIITVDCGTNSVDAAEFCIKNGIDLIITDHHEIIGPVPAAFALINPKNKNDNYPYAEITGVGVAFKLATGLLSKFDKVTHALSSRNFFSDGHNQETKNIRDPYTSSKMDSGHSASESEDQNSGMTMKPYLGGFEKWLLDLVAIGTVADCHSLLGENRILVKYGLKVLSKTKWIGLKELMNAAALDLQTKPADTYTLGFVIAPRLNAAGRLEHANIALDLLMETSISSATQKASALEAINQRRQQITAQVVSEAKEKVLAISERKILALYQEGWPKGVVGLVAGRLAEENYKPVIVLEKTGEICTGSARTAGDFDLLEAIKSASEYLIKFGGHKQAAGLSLKADQFNNFYQKLLEYADKNIKEDLERVLELEAELQFEDLQPNTYNLISSFEPFGVDNHKPKFLIKRLKIASLRSVGAEKQHLQLQLQKAEKTIAGIAFNSGYLEKNIKLGDTVDVAAELIEDAWNGRSQVKLRVVDLKVIND